MAVQSPYESNREAGRSYGIRPPRYRLPDSAEVGRVRLQVADLGRSLGFYENVLGLHVLARHDGQASLAPADTTRPLVELVERPGASPVPQRGRLGLFHFAILLPDRPALGRMVPHLVGAGVRLGASDHLVSEALYLSDPDGLGIEVYADRPRSSWESKDRELVMSTLPLDIDDVVAASDGQAWSGMPAGTRMGHVHLHVGDLSKAAAFYHEALGLDKTVWTYPHALFLSAGGYHHHLGVNTWAGPRAMPPSENEAQLLEWELVLPTSADLESLRASLESSGERIESQNGSLLVRDPWDTALRLRLASTRAPRDA